MKFDTILLNFIFIVSRLKKHLNILFSESSPTIGRLLGFVISGEKKLWHHTQHSSPHSLCLLKPLMLTQAFQSPAVSPEDSKKLCKIIVKFVHQPLQNWLLNVYQIVYVKLKYFTSSTGWSCESRVQTLNHDNDGKQCLKRWIDNVFWVDKKCLTFRD